MKSRSTSRSIRSSDWPVCLRHQLVGDLANAQDLARVNVDVGRLSAQSAHRRLMDQDARVRQRKPLALLARHQQKCPMLAAWPMQNVTTSFLMYCIVS